MKKGFNTSIGCNLKKYKSNHLLAPLTSIPKIGTKAKKINEIVNNGITNFLKIEVSIKDILIMTKRAKKVKIRCLEKKK